MARVLLVEDDADIRAAVAIKLTGAGHDVCEAPDGASALSSVPGFAPDVVVLDMRLPDIHGLEVCRTLRADPVTAALPVIAVTVRAGPDDEAAAIGAGVTAYLTKPFSLNELADTVDRLASRPA